MPSTPSKPLPGWGGKRLSRGAAEDELVRTLSPAEAARRTGRTVRAVYKRRHVLFKRGQRFGRRGVAGRGEGHKVTTTTTLVLLVLGALATAAVVWVRLRLWAPKEEEFYHFRCRGCRRRLRYRRVQEGHTGKCSHCGQALIFPPVSQAIE
jgi:hypothetical protein